MSPRTVKHCFSPVILLAIDTNATRLVTKSLCYAQNCSKPCVILFLGNFNLELSPRVRALRTTRTFSTCLSLGRNSPTNQQISLHVTELFVARNSPRFGLGENSQQRTLRRENRRGFAKHPAPSPSVRSARQRRAARSANRRAERTVSARGRLRESHSPHLLRVRPARVTSVPPRSNRLRARRLSSLSISAYGTHTSIGSRTHHANENPLISDRSPWRRNIYTVNMISRIAAITVRPLFRHARGYLRAVGH